MTGTRAQWWRGTAPYLLMFLALLAVAVVSFVFVRSKHGDGMTFITAQRHAQALTPQSVARVVRLAPDPATRARGLRAQCRPQGAGELHNPWQCQIDYRSGKRIGYTVDIRLSGAFLGTHQLLHYQGRTVATAGHITGCCIVIP